MIGGVRPSHLSIEDWVVHDFISWKMKIRDNCMVRIEQAAHQLAKVLGLFRAGRSLFPLLQAHPHVASVVSNICTES